jgi:hypothetical protein
MLVPEIGGPCFYFIGWRWHFQKNYKKKKKFPWSLNQITKGTLMLKKCTVIKSCKGTGPVSSTNPDLGPLCEPLRCRVLFCKGAFRAPFWALSPCPERCDCRRYFGGRLSCQTRVLYCHIHSWIWIKNNKKASSSTSDSVLCVNLSKSTLTKNINMSPHTSALKLQTHKWLVTDIHMDQVAVK